MGPERDRLNAEVDGPLQPRDRRPLPAVDRVVAGVVDGDVARELRVADADGAEVDARADERELVLPAGDAEMEILPGVDGAEVAEAAGACAPTPDTRMSPAVGSRSLATSLPSSICPQHHSLARDHDRCVDRAQLEHPVADRAAAGQGRRDGSKATEQDETEPPHRQGQSFAANYALNERNVRSFGELGRGADAQTTL